MKQTSIKIGRRTALFTVMVVMMMALVPSPGISAQTVNPEPAAKVSFTFDDGLASTYTNALPILSKYGLTGTDYIITGCVGMTTTPNTCRANQDRAYMTWAQIQALQNTYGWEIGSHTVDHDCLASSAAQDPADCQRTKLTAAQIDTELSQSKSTLAANGIQAQAFAPPYGDYNNVVLAQVAKYYSSTRGFKEQNNNAWPYNEYLMNNYPLLETTGSVAAAEAKVDAAISGKTWLVLTIHDVVPTPSTTVDDYQYGTTELDQIAQYVASKQTAGLLKTTRMSDGFVNSDTNLLTNPTFNDGIANGWTTDNATAITADAANNGSYPDALHAVKLVSPASGQAHLFSSAVPINSRTTYLFKNFLNVQAITGGQVAFYVDEYDASGNWISGQYSKQETTPFVENMNFAYKPTSVSVSKAALQVIVGGSGITAYLDNADMMPLTTAAAPTNLLTNGTFDSGIASGWSTDSPTYITADAANNGAPANPVNSVKLTAGTASNAHLFSPLVAVSSGHNYSLSAYLHITALSSGEVGFYVDEYDASGNWISGHYVTGVRQLSNGTVGLVYTPQSSTVAKASLQVIVVKSSGITAYFDDASWSAAS